MDRGVYVHIPFCSARCDYCAFATWTDRADLMAAYAGSCVAELRAAALEPVDTVFFGGGTPSLLPAPLLAAVLAAVPRAPGAEVTVECNPEDVTPALLDAYLAAGVNRISLGVQSFAPHVLTSLGRWHGGPQAGAAAALVAGAGFDSWSLDLIYGAAGESFADWLASIEAALALEPPHVSAYALTVEQGTPLSRDPVRWPDDDECADRYLAADGAFLAAGLENYEISNWARPGHECRHNRIYWDGGWYLGVGCAAHSFDPVSGRRWWNVRTPERYIERVTAGEPAVAGEEVLGDADRELEALQLALRTSAGVPVGALPDVDGLEELVALAGERAVLTPRGRLLANEVAGRLVAPARR